MCGLIAIFATCSTPQQTPTTPAEPASARAEERAREVTAEPAGPTFDPDIVRVAPDSTIGRIRHALEVGAPELAGQLALAALPDAAPDELPRLWWLSARAARDAGTPVQAFSTFANVADADHPLAPWARLERAEILLEGDAQLAADEVEPLTELEWGGQRRARELQAAALVAADRPEQAEPLLRELLAERGSSGANASVAVPLAELLAARDDRDAVEEAIGLLQGVANRAPLSAAGRRAEARAAELLRTLPRARRRRLSHPDVEQAFARAMALAAATRFADAEAAFEEVAARATDDALECRARYQQGRAIYYQRHRRRAAEHLVRVARECDDPEVRAWSYFLAGRGFRSAGEDELALVQYARLEQATPEHSLADDARYRAARIDGDRGDEAAMVAKLEALPVDYPDGDMRGRARFLLAWRARRSGDTEASLAHFDALIEEGIGEDREDLAGRARYWRGRILASTGHEEQAREAWMRVVREAPLTYYAQQALSRLQEAQEASATTARALLGERTDGSIRFPWRDELDTAAFARALELLRVGEVAKAEIELAWLEAQGDSDDELRWIHAALLDRVGAHSRSVFLTRRQLRSFMQRPPAGAHFARWRIAYPRAYAGAIESAAAEQPVPPELLFAIAREESSFRADAVSVAHAYGLTQLLVPTAQRFGRRLELRATSATLRDPVVNLRIGAAYMGWLWHRYEANPVVLPSAYNAGQGATDRWLRERPEQDLDEWIEDIPYDETRRYTRRVLQTWGIYTWLNRGELPELAAQLPSR